MISTISRHLFPIEDLLVNLQHPPSLLRHGRFVVLSFSRSRENMCAARLLLYAHRLLFVSCPIFLTCQLLVPYASL
jgi:hypothetical protein